MGGDCRPVGRAVGVQGFQSAPPHGGRQWAEEFQEEVEQFQSAPPHGGRHSHLAKAGSSIGVSIRAPAWGATHQLDSPDWPVCFNPRPRMGGDICLFGGTGTSPIGFQSAPPHGGRHQPGVDAGAVPGVSIRAPAWGATTAQWSWSAPCTRFNPRPRMGGDADFYIQLSDLRGFNPRPRMGGDVPRPRVAAPDLGFQSAPPHGGRPRATLLWRFRLSVSIRAPAWGATQR